jgi:hypothetical protein
MGKGMLMDKMLKLIIEDVYVTRADQICSHLNIDNNTAVQLLNEMERSEHIQLIKSGSQQVPVIIVKPTGRQFYRSSSYSQLYNEIPKSNNNRPAKLKLNKRTLTWTIIGILAVIFLIVAIKQGWFS